jgi:hypothetical protein
MLRSRRRPPSTGFIEPCLPSNAPRPPVGDQWLHEVTQDGYRMMARRDAAGTRLLTRNGYDRTSRFPQIAAAGPVGGSTSASGTSQPSIDVRSTTASWGKADITRTSANDRV